MIQASPEQARAFREEVESFVRSSRTPKLRPMRRFAEQELVLPDGPHKGELFRCENQPFSRHYLDAVDSRRYRRHVAVGPSQSGKTLIGFVLPILYHLFEIGETVIVGTPSETVARDKWKEDLLPAIAASRYADFLPTRGAGSKGGWGELMEFGHGAALRFMTAGGDDKSRAAFTARALVVTEVEAFGTTSETSGEADKLKQLQARLRAYRADQRVEYLECTVGEETGKTWREYSAGTRTMLALPCPHCAAFVVPEREHLTGWQDAANEFDAEDNSRVCCPACGVPWSEEQRVAANHAAVPLAHGQHIEDGRPVGDPPRTHTFSFRWNAINNLFTTASEIGVDEWNARRDPDEENAEREMCLFVWAIPHQSDTEIVTPLETAKLQRRTRFPHGLVPLAADWLTLGIDVGQYLCYWTLIGWNLETAAGWIVDYGRFDVPSKELGIDPGLLAALRSFRDEQMAAGWTHESGKAWQPDEVWIDSHWHPEPIRLWCSESGEQFRSTIGYGTGRRGLEHYPRPKGVSPTVLRIEPGYHFVRHKDGSEYVAVHVDPWKTNLHQRLGVPEGPGAIELYAATPNDHLAFVKQLTAEEQRREFVEGKGERVYWHAKSKNNHWLDSTLLATVAADFCGVRWLPEGRGSRVESREEEERALLTLDGRPYLITERGS